MIVLDLLWWFVGGGGSESGPYRAAAGQFWLSGAAAGELHAD